MFEKQPVSNQSKQTRSTDLRELFSKWPKARENTFDREELLKEYTEITGQTARG